MENNQSSADGQANNSNNGTSSVKEGSKSGKSKVKQEESCSVCLVEFNDDDDVRVTICGHIFHSTCLPQWLKTQENCPLCRHDLTNKSLYDAMKEREKTGGAAPASRNKIISLSDCMQPNSESVSPTARKRHHELMPNISGSASAAATAVPGGPLRTFNEQMNTAKSMGYHGSLRIEQVSNRTGGGGNQQRVINDQILANGMSENHNNSRMDVISLDNSRQINIPSYYANDLPDDVDNNSQLHLRPCEFQFEGEENSRNNNNKILMKKQQQQQYDKNSPHQLNQLVNRSNNNNNNQRAAMIPPIIQSPSPVFNQRAQQKTLKSIKQGSQGSSSSGGSSNNNNGNSQNKKGEKKNNNIRIEESYLSEDEDNEREGSTSIQWNSKQQQQQQQPSYPVSQSVPFETNIFHVNRYNPNISLEEEAAMSQNARSSSYSNKNSSIPNYLQSGQQQQQQQQPRFSHRVESLSEQYTAAGVAGAAGTAGSPGGKGMVTKRKGGGTGELSLKGQQNSPFQKSPAAEGGWQSSPSSNMQNRSPSYNQLIMNAKNNILEIKQADSLPVNSVMYQRDGSGSAKHSNKQSAFSPTKLAGDKQQFPSSSQQYKDSHTAKSSGMFHSKNAMNSPSPTNNTRISNYNIPSPFQPQDRMNE